MKAPPFTTFRPEFAEGPRHVKIPSHPASAFQQMARTKQIVHFADLRAEPQYIGGDPAAVALADRAGARASACGPRC